MRRRDDKFPDNGFEAWGGYMQAKISKLEDQINTRAGKEDQITNIFNGISVFVNGFTNPSADEIKILMAKHGGIYHTYQRTEDFTIASNLPDTKVKKMSLSKVVKPEWITDCIKANKLLDYRQYLLYTNSRLQGRLNFAKSNDTTKLNDIKPGSSKLDPETIMVDKSIGAQIEDNSHLIPKSSEQITKTAADPNFLSEFYNNSRLHHISQLGAMFKQHINDLREQSDFYFPARVELKENILSLYNSNKLSQITFEGGKTIMHIDMDCFFVSVGLRNKPELKGKPIAVTHSKGGQPKPKRPGVDRNAEFNLYRNKHLSKLGNSTDMKLETRVDGITDEDDKYGSMSEIASCSYEARAKGVKNGMFMGSALKLCPDIQTIPYDFEGYKEVAFTLYNTIAQYTLDIEAVSCDEMYVDCTEILKTMDITVQDFATVIRDEIRRKTGCPCSTGFGGNRLQARLATKKAKPDGQFFLSAEFVEDFMYDIKLTELPGVGRQTAHKLENLGHQTCGSLQNQSLLTLQQHLGIKTGAQLYDQCRGRDTNPLSFHTVRKSVSAEVNYGIRFENNDQCVQFLKQLCTELHSRMDQYKVTGKCITLKLMVRAEDAPVETAKFMGHGFCNVINKSTALNNFTNDLQTITKEVLMLCEKQNVDPKEMRGVGIQMTKLESTSKQIKGAINKYFSKPFKKSNTKIENISNHILEPQIDSNRLQLPTTPKKANIPSPSKRSPSNKKSPIIKRRGRPPKSVSLSKNKISTSKGSINKFLHGETVRTMQFKSPMIKEEKLCAKEPEVNDSSKCPIVKQEPQGLLSLTWERVRELLRAWLDSGQAPLQCDIDLITEYMTEMVINKNIEKLNILLNFLRRRTSEINSNHWSKVYSHIVENVQNAMIAVYGKKLHLND